MFKTGIIQGRIYPERFDQLQVFPVLEWKKEFAKAREIGFDYIELLYDRDENEANPLLSVNRYQEILELKKNTGIGISSICVDYFVSINLTKDANNKSLEKIKYLIDYAHKLKVECIIIPFFFQNQLKNGDELVRFLQKAQKQINNAQKYGVEICIETDLSAEAMIQAIQTASSNVKICYDIGNSKALGFSPEKEIIALDNLIGHVHIKDRPLNGPNVMLGEGDVDFPACLNALREINYQGILILETPYGRSPVSDAARNREYMNNYLSGVQI